MNAALSGSGLDPIRKTRHRVPKINNQASPKASLLPNLCRILINDILRESTEPASKDQKLKDSSKKSLL